MRIPLILLLALLVSLRLVAQPATPPAGRLVVTTLDSKLLRGNPGGENLRRRVSVYLPAGYDASPQRRYLVVYYLHGFTWNDSLIFNQDGMKALHTEARYVIDSFPVAVCQNVRIPRCKLLTGEAYRSRSTSKWQWFYGF